MGREGQRTRDEAREDWSALAEEFVQRNQPRAVFGEPLGDSPVIFPGSFNPLHDGHRTMADLARRRLQRPVHFEISIANVDKPSLTAAELARRLDQFSGRNLVVTRAARFTEKSRLLPNAFFLIGADTLRRIVSPRYYPDESSMLIATRTLSEHIAGLLVFGRLCRSGEKMSRFEGAASIVVPEPLRAKCIEVSEAEFRMDVSSTELRRNTGRG